MRHLPPGGSLHRALDPEGWRWSNTEELLATLLETIDLGNRMFFGAHSKPGTPRMEPVKVPRPSRPGETKDETP